MFTVYTDTTLIAPNIEDLDVARATAEQFASTGYTSYIRDDTTGDTIATIDVPEKEEKPMTYLDYANENPDFHPAWCQPYADSDEERFLVVHDGLASLIDSPEVTSVRGEDLCDFESDLGALAQTVNPDYDLYTGYTDQQIALMKMHEIGCSACPFRYECETMAAEMDETDYV